MSTGTIVLIVVLIILIAALVALYFFGKKTEKKQAEQKAQMDAMAQTMNMLIIDKKRMKLKEAGLPSVVVENTPKYLRRTKVAVVKAKDHDTDVRRKSIPADPGEKRSKGCRKRHLHNRSQRCARTT